MKNETKLKMNEVLNSTQLFQEANLEVMTKESLTLTSGGAGHIHFEIGGYGFCIRWN